MKKILIIGAGGQGGPCASILSRVEDVSEILLELSADCDKHGFSILDFYNCYKTNSY